MGIETNPQSVDDLNEAWPAKGEPAKEGYRHLQNIKKVVKAKANAAGVYGVTTLTSALDSDSELKAASAKAAKDLRDLITAVEEAIDAVATALEELDTSVGENAVPLNGLWEIALGDTVRVQWVNPMLASSTANSQVLQSSVPYTETSWRTLGSFTCFNDGAFRLKFNAWRQIGNTSGVLGLRLLKNGAAIWTQNESRTDMNNEGTNGVNKEYQQDVSDVTAGDFFEFQFRFTGLESFAIASFCLRRFQIATGTTPALAPIGFHPASGNLFVYDNT